MPTDKIDREQLDRLMYGDEQETEQEQEQEVEQEVEQEADDIEEEVEVQEEEQEEEQEEPEQYLNYDKPLNEMTKEELESFAEKQGWRPNFKGDKSLSAEEYLQKSETEVPVMRDTIRKMASKIEAMESGMVHQRDMLEKRLRREYEEKLEQIRATKSQMEEDGLYEKADFDKYKKLDEAEKEYSKEIASYDKSQGQQQEPNPQEMQKVNSIIDNFVNTKATWYKENPYLRSVADSLVNTVNEMYPNEPLEKKLEVVDKMVRENNPHIFANEKRKQPNKVQSVNRSNAIPKKTNVQKNYSFQDLSPQDKNEFKIFEGIKFGLKAKRGESAEDFKKRLKVEKQKIINEYCSSYKQT